MSEDEKMTDMQPMMRGESDKPIMTVDEAVEADRAFFDANPDVDEYIRDFVPGEFGKLELPEASTTRLTSAWRCAKMASLWTDCSD
jgi:hypothetical protein